jgi:two-component system chemotaxis sensor kinase CheA
VLFAAADGLERAVQVATDGGDPGADVADALEHLRRLAEAAGALPERRRTTAEAVVAGPDAPDGPGLVVRVRQADDALMPGVRAYLAVERARSLGDVTAVVPDVETLQAATTPQTFVIRLVTTVGPVELERAIRSAGDVASVAIEDADGEAALAARRSGAAARQTGEFAAATAEFPVPGRMAPAPDAVPAARSVRIDLAKLDGLTNLVGELVIARGRLAQLSQPLGDVALDEAVAQAGRLIGDIQDQVMSARMVPVWQVFDRFPRLVRDAARQTGKRVALTIEGKEIELDRSLLDEIGDPLVHLLRNAVDHGIEAPEARAAAGKPPEGRLVLSATRDRSAVLIRVTDDGRGIDRTRVLAKARAQGLVAPDLTALTDEELFRVIARPGFSTAEVVTGLSGRGVGIDAVQAKVRALGGSVELRTVEGEGTAWTLRLPLTLAIVRALIARVADERYAVPLTHVTETVELAASGRGQVRGREVLLLRDDVLPVVPLRAVVGLPTEERPDAHVIVVERGERRAGVVVDELLGQQEIVVKQFDGARDGLALFSGATILGDGAPALIVDIGSLL